MFWGKDAKEIKPHILRSKT